MFVIGVKVITFFVTAIRARTKGVITAGQCRSDWSWSHPKGENNMPASHFLLQFLMGANHTFNPSCWCVNLTVAGTYHVHTSCMCSITLHFSAQTSPLEDLVTCKCWSHEVCPVQLRVHSHQWTESCKWLALCLSL